VNTLVLNMASALRQALGRSVRVDLRLPRDLWAVWIDVEEFETALLNIADNAREAMPNGGIFSIVGRNIDSGEDYAQEYAEAAAEVPSGRQVLLSLTDNGAGMADDVIERAFEPFSTTKPTGQATGLGLSQVFGFVRQSGGHITLVSAPGTGTSVRILLPAVVDAVEEVERPSGMGGSYPLAPHGEVVLVVEHDERVRHHIVGGLARLGYTAIEAGTVAAALELLRAGERIDLLMLDAVMPNGDHGTTFAREAVACRPGLKVLYLSGHTQSALARDGIIGSNDPVLLKPFLKAELARGVHAVLDAGGVEEG
jgi:CheY-like chemotaxis protein